MFMLFYIGYLIHVHFDENFQEALNQESQFAPPWFVRISFPIFIFALGLFFGLLGIWYYYPEIRPSQKKDELGPQATPYEVLIYISTPDEVKVIEAIKKLENKAYQFEIARYTGLSKMKVHRIIQRLAERGIIDIEKRGKYNRISLKKWVISNNKTNKN